MIFGFKNNKCKGNVYTTDEVDNLLAGKSGTGHTHADYKLKGDFAVITGEAILDQGNATVYLDLPEGFTANNCVVISCGRDYTGNGYVVGTLGVQVEMMAGLNTAQNKLQIIIFDNDLSSNTISYKIVLMKI